MHSSATPLPQKAGDIPARAFDAGKVDSVPTATAPCPICRQPLKEKDFVKQTPCGHLFHARCLDLFLQSELCCPECRLQVLFPAAHAAIVHEGRAANPAPYYGAGGAPLPRAVPVAAGLAPLDGSNAQHYAACRDCGQMFYRDRAQIRPDTNAWYRCPACRPVNIVELVRASCSLQ